MLASTALTVAGGLLSCPAAWAAEPAKEPREIPHDAQPLHVKVGGFMEQFFGYVDQDVPGRDVSGFDVKSDTEIWFTGAAVLDNGIQVAVDVQLEGNSTGDQIDESHLKFTGGFGQVVLGSENSAMYMMHVAPKDFGFGLNSGDNVEWVDFTGVGGDTGVFRGPFGSTYTEPGRVNDANRLTYMTPRFGGFQLGASYVPKATEDDNTSVDRSAASHDGVALAAQYKGNIGPVAVGASLGWGMMQAADSSTASDPTAYNAGLSLGVGAWTLAAAAAGSDGDSATGDSTGWTVGLNYAPGPWKLSLAGFFGDRDGSATANAGGTGARKASFDTVQLEAGYDLGPGVSVVGVLGYADVDDRSGFGSDSDAVYGVSMVRLSF
ncbi:porin [Thalassobaculum sp.]|uniref:porin n=1 Tax=Thalassobaculum sp. TaxID=2022740 RepID=UPI0032EB4F24